MPLADIEKQGPFTYYFPNGVDRLGEETGEIWTQARWDAGRYPEGEELADLLRGFVHPCKEMSFIQGA